MIVGVLAFALGIAIGASREAEEAALVVDLNAAMAEVEGERAALVVELEALESERDELATDLEAVTTEREELAGEVDDARAERDEALERVEAVEAASEEDQGQTEDDVDLRRLQILALTSVLLESPERVGLCDAWALMGDEATANVINSELDPDEQFPVDVVAEVFGDVCG